jgi:hypothetical protein
MSFLHVSYRSQLSAATSSLVSFYRDDLLKLARNNSHSDLRNASPASFCLYGWLDSVLHGYVESGLSWRKKYFVHCLQVLSSITPLTNYSTFGHHTTTRTGREEVRIAA